MATTTNRKGRAIKECRECDNWRDVKEQVRISELLASAIKAIEARLKSKEYKPTVADYLKLLQMEQELEQDAPKEIKVTWVEPLVTSDSER